VENYVEKVENIVGNCASFSQKTVENPVEKVKSSFQNG
jgi:hypothetical protein